METLHFSLALVPLTLLVPLLYAAAGVATFFPSAPRETPWPERLTLVVLAVSALLLAGTWGMPDAALAASAEIPRSDLRWWLRIDGVTGLVLTLIALLGWVITRYSRRYLQGEPETDRYARWLMFTLTAVSVLVMANHLVMIVVAWLAVSLCLHQLLTFYRDRQPAIIAAHKKFIISRVADVALFGAVAALSMGVGDLSLDGLAQAASSGVLPVSMEIAAVLIVLGAALRCAQLPFHGWLIGVMEAPTPVSALLHAGVVNIAGIVLLRLSPWMQHAEVAQTLLVIIGAGTALIAALVMSTQTSVKVTLAWSTSAQMGLMLMQCGLGLYGWALLHLVAHSLYKAYGFLSAGSTVARHSAAARSPSRAPATATAWLLASMAATAAVIAATTLLGQPSTSPAMLATAALMALGLTPALVRMRRMGPVALLSLPALLVGALVLHHALGLFADGQNVAAAAPSLGALVRAAVAVSFLGVLMATQIFLATGPQTQLAQRLVPWLRAGLYIDPWFTRATFRIWPPRLRAEMDLRQRRALKLKEA